jgi:hypothetical protein
MMKIVLPVLGIAAILAFIAATTIGPYLVAMHFIVKYW